MSKRILQDESSSASKPGQTPTASSLAEAGLQAFEVVEVDRSQLLGAPYNPRKLSEAQRKKLKAGLRRHGLVSPPTWNTRTGNIVGGHQRLAIMDSLMGSKNYKLHVARIDVDVSREKELNILLNNTMAQGEWDIGALTEMFKDDAIKVEGTGFDLGDVYQLMGESPFEERAEDASKMAEKLDAVKGLYDTIRDRNQARESTEFYLVFVWKNEDRLARFMELHGMPTSRYHDGERLTVDLGYDLDAPAANEDQAAGG